MMEAGEHLARMALCYPLKVIAKKAGDEGADNIITMDFSWLVVSLLTMLVIEVDGLVLMQLSVVVVMLLVLWENQKTSIGQYATLAYCRSSLSLVCDKSHFKSL